MGTEVEGTTAAAAEAEARTVDPVRRTARNGLLLMAAGPLVAALGDPAVLVWAAPTLLLPALGAFLVTRFGRWASVLAAVLGLLGILIGLSSAWVVTAAFGSVLDVVPTTMFVVGGAVALVAGGLGVTSRGRDTVVRPLWLGGLAVVAVVGLASGAVALTTSDDVDPAALAAATAVSVDERGFTPEELALPEGATVTLALRNEGRIAHTFTSDALDVDVVLSPGEVALVEVDVPVEVGGLQYWCVPHSQETEDGRREWMVGELAAAG